MRPLEAADMPMGAGAERPAPQLLGVCGSVGKTTVILMAEEILRANGRRVGILTPPLARGEGVLLPGEGIPADAARIRYILERLQEAGCELVLVECGIHRLVEGVFSDLPFAGVLLSAYDPQEREPDPLPDGQRCQQALEELLCRVPLTVLPAGETRIRAGGQIWRFGGASELCAQEPHPETRDGRPGRGFTLVLDGQAHPAFLPVPADFAVTDALAAIRLCLLAGLTLAQILPCLETLAPTGTLELIGTCNGARVYRDSAFLPRAISRAVYALRQLTVGRLCVLIGSVGGRSAWRRAPLALAAAEADLIYLTADDPDVESPAGICEEMKAGLPAGVRATFLSDRREAICQATEDLCPDDLLLLVGKGLGDCETQMGHRQQLDERALLISEGFFCT